MLQVLVYFTLLRRFSGLEFGDIYSANEVSQKLGLALCSPEKFPLAQHHGVLGYLTPLDCAALYNFANHSANNWKRDRNSGDHLLYAETGSFNGLSAHIVAAAAKSTNTPILIYSHDLFDLADERTSLREGGESIWNVDSTFTDTRLRSFYSNVIRNKLTNVIIPIIGICCMSGKLFSYHCV